MNKINDSSGKFAAILSALKGFFSLGSRAWKGAAYILLVIGVTVWFAWPGPRYQLNDYVVEQVGPGLCNLDNPAENGTYSVLTLTYGSGTDRRSDYGEDVDIIKEILDITPMVRGGRGINGCQDIYQRFFRSNPQ